MRVVRIVVGDAQHTDVLDGDGRLVRSYVAFNFDVSADGSTMALVGAAKLWVVAVGHKPGTAQVPPLLESLHR